MSEPPRKMETGNLQVNLVKELDVVLLIERDSEAVGERFTPEVAFIATWQNVIVKTGFLGWRNTFQLVFPNDGTRSITVFNYGLMTALSDTKFAGVYIIDREESHLPRSNYYDILFWEEIESFPYYYLTKDGRQEHLAIGEKRFEWRTIRSPTCQYWLGYNPNVGAKELSLYVGPYYNGKMFGMCQNDNGILVDDWKDCSFPPQNADVGAIAERCSCPLYDNTCIMILYEI
ncbi:hypothetical protein LSH36_359g00055 [Paralvinella palmiformis]|uniref:NIDO domain-containing protein n=1 Tax=Paralvinella palmiformis TaxID=53620 RepID=A0AAD9JE93_9ANNE|nr:hypothetical protein LSH36_359g00055 [Paralvinella palmiformis]